MTYYKFNVKYFTQREFCTQKDTTRQLPLSLQVSVMPFPHSQLAICVQVLSLSWPAVRPYVRVISATKA